MKTFTVAASDPRYLPLTHRVSGKLRNYTVNLRVGEEYAVVPNNEKSLPVCKLEMKMQERIASDLVSKRTPATASEPLQEAAPVPVSKSKKAE